VHIRRGIAFLEPDTVTLKANNCDELDQFRDIDFVRGLKLRLGYAWSTILIDLQEVIKHVTANQIQEIKAASLDQHRMQYQQNDLILKSRRLARNHLSGMSNHVRTRSHRLVNRDISQQNQAAARRIHSETSFCPPCPHGRTCQALLQSQASQAHLGLW
jgi:hypothetical protein